ncbi:MAG: transcriptional regulator FtrA [Phenylobacterium sp.]|uniref:transcriptional regulator FtrA n=1 Tax=Phenylobacterium sp. TaxID=1871053 RepID=UPI0027287769|nr:transcriptional regulator FtrA [Phenylobacterium sp.]MDO8913690.1 transcriptional regulator FtrA [Phenylobacterium sp.]MDP3099010.1 transcriptional regulator FtrA [Phenylobacterium sp.]
MPTDTTPPNRSVVALVYDNLCSFEFGCAAEVFGLPRPEVGPDWYSFATAAVEPGPITAMGGLRFEASGGLEVLKGAGTVVVPGWKGADVQPSAELVAALRAAYAGGARLVTICSGVFVLAAAGLLDGRRATTHWRYAETLRQRYPRIEVDPNVLYVDEGQILTSAGSAAGLDLCLHVVRRDFGARIANQVARRLVIAPHRDGGQAQFIERPLASSAGGRLSQLIAELQEEPQGSPSIQQLAARAAMSERTFIRRFRETTGMAPGAWLVAVRVDRARDLLETTDLSIEQVAAESGFGAATTLRHHFRSRLGLSPAAYRDRFGAAAAALGPAAA